jgi:probable F420-dependent oxidoreductase
MDSMAIEIGVALPQAGTLASRQAIIQTAQAAERLGFASVWTHEHLMRPTGAVPGVFGGQPFIQSQLYGSSFNSLMTLTCAADHTSRIRLGSGILIAPFYAPLLLAQLYSTLDHLSNGRVIAGIGMGWMDAEFQAIGVKKEERGRRFEECIHALRMLWGPNPVSFSSDFWTIAEAEVLKPLQSPLPIVIGAFAPAALERAGRIGDGVMLGNFAWSQLAPAIQLCRKSAERAGHDPLALQMMVRVERIQKEQSFVGTIEEICADLLRAKQLGIDHVIFEPRQFASAENLEEQIGWLERLAAALPTVA